MLRYPRRWANDRFSIMTTTIVLIEFRSVGILSLNVHLATPRTRRSEEHTSELQSRRDLPSFPTRRSSDLVERPVLHHDHNNSPNRIQIRWHLVLKCSPRHAANEPTIRHHGTRVK